MRLISQLKRGDINFIKDLSAGVVVALVSIPIALGYAQIAGLPVVYGLYGSVIPIIIYAFFTTSRQFVVGVDAMPAAMIGGLLAEIGIAGESSEATSLVPVVSLMVACWFLLFYLFKAGRIVKFISAPVMGGFISGVGITIILMQIPKLFGGSSGTGEIFVLLVHIISEINEFNLFSFLLGIGTITVILICKKYIPKFPMTVVMLGVGGLLELIFKLSRFGVKMLPEVNPGFPRFLIPNIGVLFHTQIALHIPSIFLQSLSIAAVIMAQTLLATGSYASKYGDDVDNNMELLAYGAMNFGGAFIGCCPINGSVSRSKIADSFGARSQVMSIVAGITMVMVLMFGTPMFEYLPIPVLTGIVMTALIGIIDTGMMKRLWKTSKNELLIFILSMCGVLVFGTVYGVIIGCLLSFWEVAIRAVVPPVSFVGRIPGIGNFHSLSRNSLARPIKNTIIYRFSGNLFFANIDKFIDDIEGAIKTDTHQVVVDARGIGNIDITSVDKLISFNRKLRSRNIRFYITEHEGSLNDQIRRMGGETLIEDGVVRRTITLALRDAGLEKPYILEDTSLYASNKYYEMSNDASAKTANVNKDNKSEIVNVIESDDKLSEFEWAFGEEALEYMEKLADRAAENMATELHEGKEHLETIDSHGAKTQWGMLGLFDEHEFWDHLEVRILELVEEGKISREEAEKLESRIEKRRECGEHRLSEINPHALDILSEHRRKMLEKIKEHDVEEYNHLRSLYEKIHRK